MDVPEIQHLVIHHLRNDNRSLSRCSRVTKTWCEPFLSCLYRHRRLVLHDNYDKHDSASYEANIRARMPSSLGLERNGCHIKALDLYLPCRFIPELLTWTSKVQRLLILSLEVFNRKTFQYLGVGLQDLLDMNPGIQRLQLEGFRGPEASRSIEQVLQLCPHLRKLVWSGVFFDFSDLAYLQACACLSSLRLKHCTVTISGGPLFRPVSLPKLKYFKFDMCHGQGLEFIYNILEMIARWPQLHTMRIDLGTELKRTPHATLIGPYPTLSKLELYFTGLDDDELARLLKACTQLATLKLKGQALGDKSFEVLMVNLTWTLTALTIDKTTEPRIQRRILRSLPRLLNFSCDQLFIDTEFAIDGVLPQAASSSSSSPPLPFTGSKALARWDRAAKTNNDKLR